MDLSDPRTREIFFEVHRDLPREGPGNRASTEQALQMVGALPEGASVLDIGCGPGMQTLHLARALPDARIQAIDAYKPFVIGAETRLKEAGLGERVSVTVADMTALPFEPDSFDLIWCEAAAYSMGVPEALKAWKPLLKSGGRLGFSEVVWLRDDAPAFLRDWWEEEYPDIRTADALRALVAECGYRLIGDFVLPEAAWWDDYYKPMARRIERLTAAYKGDAVALSVLEDCQAEIDNYRECSEYYGYLFCVLEPAT